ncbi:MAG: type IV toxin-antitoxin system AbiEi family antitoxin domain-containing protein [Actinomycetota bacterium]
MWNEADAIAARVAEAQLGLIHRRDLRDSGISDAAIQRRLCKGLLVRRRPGVYAYAGTPEFARQRILADILSIDSDALLSHNSAAHEWKLISMSPRVPHVVVRRWNREHRSSCLVHESLDLIPADRSAVDGLPITSAVRTVVDLGATSPWLVERALGTGLRLELFTVEQVQKFVKRVARRGRRGVGVIRPLLDLHNSIQGRTESVLEDRFLRVLFESEIELPELQFEVFDNAGLFVCRADFAYPRRGVLIELDGRSYHSDSVAFQRDRDKQNRTQELGWTTLRFTWDDVHRRPDHVAATVLAVLA